MTLRKRYLRDQSFTTGRVKSLCIYTFCLLLYQHTVSIKDVFFCAISETAGYRKFSERKNKEPDGEGNRNLRGGVLRTMFTPTTVMIRDGRVGESRLSQPLFPLLARAFGLLAASLHPLSPAGGRRLEMVKPVL